MSAHLTDEQIDDFVDMRLTPAEHFRVQEHVAGCGRCGGAMQRTRELLDAARSLARVEVPDGLWPLVASETVVMSKVRRQFPMRVRLLLAAAGCFLVIATGLIVHAYDNRGAATETHARPASIVRGPPQDTAFYQQRELELRAASRGRSKLLLAGIDSLTSLDRAIGNARLDSSEAGAFQLARLLEARHYFLRELLRTLGEEAAGPD